MVRIKFDEVSVSRQRRGKCCVCGRQCKRQRKFSQKFSSSDLRDGQAAYIHEALEDRANRWARRKLACQRCEGAVLPSPL